MLMLHERLLLLVLDDDKGKNQVGFADKALAGALLFELLRGNAVELTDDRIGPTGVAPTDAVLRDAAAAIAGESKPRDVRWWVDHLPSRLPPFLPRLAARLVDTGVLSQEQHKVLGIFSTTRLPERGHVPEAQVRERLQAALLGEVDADADDAELAAMVAALGMVGSIVGRDRRTEAERRAKALAESAEVGEAVGKAVKAAQDAVMAAVIASTVAASVAAHSN
ncbi:MAG TPA: GPP34 family phosphoprotein [Acidothermaceae bacterium]